MNQENNIENDEWSKEIVLNGCQLKLEPLSLMHLDDLEQNLLDPHSWNSKHWGFYKRNDLRTLIERSFEMRQSCKENAFAMVMTSTREAVGISRLMAFKKRDHVLEIGGTWIAQHWQKTFVNTEAKLLMLTYAFEKLCCQRVEFRVDALNFNSQRAVLRLGAKYEGELRNIYRLPNGRQRDYKIYSILATEWLNLKSILNWYLEKYVSAEKHSNK